MMLTRNQRRQNLNEESVATPVRTALYRDRLIFVIDGQPFYISTGKHGIFGVAFPCLGIQQSGGPYGRGWIKKNRSYTSGFKLYQKYRSVAPNSSDLSDLFGRLHTMKNLYVSVRVGGRYWNTDEGLKIAETLENQNFLKEKIILGDPELISDIPEEINAFICRVKKEDEKVRFCSDIF